MIAILGSGFGLYGYLPALVGGCGQQVVLPESYRSRFAARPELAPFFGSVQWEKDESAALAAADGVVIARRPADQVRWLPRCLEQSQVERLVLEKPLASSPEAATELLGQLSGRLFRIGYTFRHTVWGRSLKETLGQGMAAESLTVSWNFMAHHYRHELSNWKRFQSEGGGALRFYGIQLIALLAEIGYRDVVSSRTFARAVNEVERWEAVLAGTGLPDCKITVDSRSVEDRFRVEVSPNGAVFANQSDPFYSEDVGNVDRRVPALTSLCQSLWAEGLDERLWYEATIHLWASIEKSNSAE